MDKVFKFLIVGMGIFFGLFLVLAIFSMVMPNPEVIFNRPINMLIAGPPDKSCVDDSDCVVKNINCEVCQCGEAVNKDWERFCLIPKISMVDVMCEVCPSEGLNYNIKCVEGECQKVWVERG